MAIAGALQGDIAVRIQYGSAMLYVLRSVTAIFLAGLIPGGSHAAPATPAGCGRAALASGPYSMTHSSLKRAYRLHVPAGYNAQQPAPLVLVFHGWGGNENEFLDDAAVVREADAHGYIVVAPRGLGAGLPDQRNNSWTFRGSASGLAGRGPAPRAGRGDRASWEAICDTRVTPDYRYPSCAGGTARNSCSWTQCQDDDVDFTIELLRTIEQSLCVDTSRVFAAGGSNGGMFAWELGQNPKSAPLFRAFAPLIGLPHRGHLDGPANPKGARAILITGTRDPTVPPGSWDDEHFTTTSNGSDRFYYTGATAITRRWAAAAGCDVRHSAVAVDAGAPAAECRSHCTAAPGRWPAVMDCRAPMAHEYGLSWSWTLILDFFDKS
jgi:poly(3-hydroxybutyrate) depolymerase